MLMSIQIITLNVWSVERRRAAKVPPRNEPDTTPPSIPIAVQRFSSGTLSAWEESKQNWFMVSGFGRENFQRYEPILLNYDG